MVLGGLIANGPQMLLRIGPHNELRGNDVTKNLGDAAGQHKFF